jgi:hypothetical protein
MDSPILLSIAYIDTMSIRPRSLLLDERGDFVANGLLPATYKLTVTKSGFRPFEQAVLVLTAGERRSAFNHTCARA